MEIHNINRSRLLYICEQALYCKDLKPRYVESGLLKGNPVWYALMKTCTLDPLVKQYVDMMNIEQTTLGGKTRTHAQIWIDGSPEMELKELAKTALDHGLRGAYEYIKGICGDYKYIYM